MNYNSPLMKILETIANMLIVSFFWVLCSIPILTIIPASAALYHTANRIIFNGRGQGVLKDFFTTFKDNFVQGFKVNLICVAAVFFIFVGLYAGIQIYKWNVFGLLYLILGIVITLLFLLMLIYLPAVISRFYLKVWDTLRLALFFGMQNIFISILNILLLALLVLIVGVVPLAIMIAPALYVDLTRGGIEKKMQQFIEDNDLIKEVKPAAQQQLPEETESSSAADERLSRKR